MICEDSCLSYLMFGCGLETTSNLEEKKIKEEVQFEIIIKRGQVRVEGEGVSVARMQVRGW